MIGTIRVPKKYFKCLRRGKTTPPLVNNTGVPIPLDGVKIVVTTGGRDDVRTIHGRLMPADSGRGQIQPL